jgi:hypothetical protein
MHFAVTDPHDDITVRAYITPALFGGINERPIHVFVNDVPVGTWRVRTPAWYSLAVPRRVVEHRPELELRFAMANAVSPKRLGLTADTRVLAVTFDDLVMLGKNQQALPEIQTHWGSGAYGEEHNEGGTWHWCASACEVQLINPSKSPAHVQIEMVIVTSYEEVSHFRVDGISLSDSELVNGAGKRLRYTLDLSPGSHTLKMSSDAKRAQATPDPRDLVFMVRDFSVRPE